LIFTGVCLNRSKTIILFFCALLAVVSVNGQPSVLATGKWFKLGIEKEGVYKIDFTLLKKMGVDPTKIDPKNIRIHGNPGGMLSQSNNIARPSDLQENAIFVKGEDDGKFDRDDFILFYAQGADKVEFIPAKDIYHYENNLYSEENFYFLTIASDPGKRVSVNEDLGAGFPIINTFNDYVYHEKDEYNDQHSGREWFGEKFGFTNEHSFSFPIAGIAPGSSIKMVSDVLGQSLGNSSFKVTFNGAPVVEQNLLPISANQYGVKGIHKRDTILISASTVAATSRSSHDIQYQFIKGSGSSSGYLDFFLISFERSLALHNDQTIFTSGSSLQNPVSTFEISGFPVGAAIWDITDPTNAKLQTHVSLAETSTFSTPTPELKKFIAFNNKVPAPVLRGQVVNQNLHGMSAPDMVIVSHPLFEHEAIRLATHREAFSGWNVAVVSPEQIFNEFSSGRQDVSAIRDFTKYLYDQNSGKLKVLLLFGKASYDFKNRIENNTNFVITYESRNSLHPLLTFSSDDYYAFLEDNEGNWGEDPVQNHTLDIGVGRLPVRNAQEAKNVVDKIIDYELGKNAFGYWRKEIVFVADDGNGEDGFTSLHQYQANQLSNVAENLNAGSDTKKLFMGAYPKTVRPNGETTPRLTDDVVNAFEKGALIINYTGHGSERQWADENFFNDQTIVKLKNEIYPFLVTATCEFGRHDDPRIVSSAERCVTAANAGAVGMVTTARPVNATTNFNLNTAFYEALMQRSGNSWNTIGEVFRRTKNNSTSGVANRNFSLLGDPSMTLALPANKAVVTTVKTLTGSDTLKALSTVMITGEIRSFADEKLVDFNGTLEATLFDKESTITTVGRNNPAFTFDQWSSALFRGKASVENGAFEMHFTVPKNIAYQIAKARLSLYAVDVDDRVDASGFSDEFKVGGSEVNVAADNTPPVITLYMNDTTFFNGGITAPDTYLVARLKDNTGINISSYGIGNNIFAELDNGARSYVLNDYYVADTDDPTSGWIRYPIKGLSSGKHFLTVRAWDVHNNHALATIEFVVTDGESLVIESFSNYPNPFNDKTTLFFTHNRSGDDLQAQVFIQNVTGEVIKSGEIMVPASDYRVNLLELSSPDENGKKLAAGLYLARVIVRSLSNGSKYEQVTKLIILN
jgi:hypothetical protein